MGEVASHSEDREGNKPPETLSVTFGDSSPKGGAKGWQPERTIDDRPKTVRRKRRTLYTQYLAVMLHVGIGLQDDPQ